jgi:acyl-CoA thioesterase FadM
LHAQGVVFNGWYLTYFDEAFTACLGARGLSYQALLEAGFDFQLAVLAAALGQPAPLRVMT